MKKLLSFIAVFVFSALTIFPQNMPFNPDTVKASKIDMGKMWTFEDAPVNYFDSTYGFKPSEQWLEKVRMSALKFANWCSASFVSADGLVMTNHHCVDFILNRIQREGEDIAANGFYAPTLKDERKVPNLFVDQLVLIEDVTDQVQSAIEEGKTDSAKAANKQKIIQKLQKQYSDDTGLICKVTELYSGGKYSLYGYRRYNDVRMALVNERAVGLYGGDPDNFTYPRYDADFAFLRVYDDDGKPLHTDYYYKWSPNGAHPGEPLFVVGNPGRTERVKTVSQMLFERDYRYKASNFLLNGVVNILENEMVKHLEKKKDLEGSTFYLANSAKVYKGIYKALLDPYFIARKKAFEKSFKAKVDANPELKAKYGHLWAAINRIQDEYRQHAGEITAFSLNPRVSSSYFTIAQAVIRYAEQMKLPEDKRSPMYTGEDLQKTIDSIFPSKFDKSVEDQKLALQVNYIEMFLPKTHPIVADLFNGLSGKKAVNYLLSKSELVSAESLKEFLKKSPEDILNSDDPFIRFVRITQPQLKKYNKEVKETRRTEKVLENELGRALFDVYGTTIPPDATFTLRISDGVMKSYHYNGTLAPLFTTFYGLYNRFYGHQQKYPWALPKRWANPPKEMKLSTPYNFISTNDIVGGNSGSPVINKNAEIVGIAFDGNIESLPGTFLYSPVANRTVSVASQGISELLNTLLHAKRIAEELKLGHIPADNK